jgi:hypothetical protein
LDEITVRIPNVDTVVVTDDQRATDENVIGAIKVNAISIVLDNTIRDEVIKRTP